MVVKFENWREPEKRGAGALKKEQDFLSFQFGELGFKYLVGLSLAQTNTHTLQR